MTANSLAFRAGIVSATATDAKKPVRLISEMRDANFRPVIRTLADALDKIHGAGLKPIGTLRGGAARMAWYGGSMGALTWIDGETETERFRVAIPISRWFRGWDQNDFIHERSITSFNGTRILRDGSLRLENNLWIDRVEFNIPRLTFVLTDTQRHLAKLVSAYLNQSGHDFPTGYIAYARLAQVELTRLQPVADFVWSHWHDDGLNASPPSRETIAATLEALFMRSRSRPRN